MVGTSAIRSPAARHRMTARRNANIVRTTRMAMGTDFVWSGLAARRANYQSRGGEATWSRSVALRPGRVARALRRKPDMATLWAAGFAALKYLPPWPMIVTTAHRRIAAAHRQQPPRARRSTLSLPR